MKYLLIFLAAFAVGWYINGIRLDRDFSEFKLKSAQEYSQLLEEVRLKETQMQQEVYKIEQKKEVEINSINDRYNALLVKYNSLHNNGTASQNSLSNASESSSRPTATCTCKQSSTARQGVREVLEVGRDCDLQAEKYNRLLKIYNSYQEKY